MSPSSVVRCVIPPGLSDTVEVAKSDADLCKIMNII